MSLFDMFELCTTYCFGRSSRGVQLLPDGRRAGHHFMVLGLPECLLGGHG